jgi:hypothetical protein
VDKLSKKLVDGYKKIVAKSGLQGYVASAGANGALMLYPKEIRNYRDWITVDTDLWRHYWFGMVNRGVMCQPYWWDEQWTISVQHTEADIDKHLAAFDEVAPGLAKAQQERGAAVVAVHLQAAEKRLPIHRQVCYEKACEERTSSRVRYSVTCRRKHGCGRIIRCGRSGSW